MQARKIYVVPSGTEITESLVETARAEGCEQIVCGLPHSMQDIFAEDDLPVVYDEIYYLEGGERQGVSQPREIDERRERGQNDVNAADFDALQKTAKAAKDLDALIAVMSDLILLVARLAEADGLTPVTPAAEVGP